MLHIGPLSRLVPQISAGRCRITLSVCVCASQPLNSSVMGWFAHKWNLILIFSHVITVNAASRSLNGVFFLNCTALSVPGTLSWLQTKNVSSVNPGLSLLKIDPLANMLLVLGLFLLFFPVKGNGNPDSGPSSKSLSEGKQKASSDLSAASF